MKPKISVVMSVYNGEKYLKEAIESILRQTFKDFEFIIVDDGSSDSTLKILRLYEEDERIKILVNEKNSGLIYSLNRGVKAAIGKYIVRMDADDIADKKRIEQQFLQMESDKNIAICGSAVNMFFEGIPLVKRRLNVPLSYEEIKVETIFQATFVHPSTIIRKEILERENLKYEDEYKYAEDYGLWTNIVHKYKAANLENALLDYRVVKQSETRKANRDISQRKEVFKLIYKNYFNKLEIERTDRNLDIHFEICMIQNLREYEYSILEKEKYLIDLKEILYKKNLDKEYINKSISEKMMKILIYQSEELNQLKSELVKDEKLLKKVYRIEKLKKYVKKFYGN